jgi:hypothetical protein
MRAQANRETVREYPRGHNANHAARANRKKLISGGADRVPLSAFTLHEPRPALPGFPNLPRTSVSGFGIVTPVWNSGLRKKKGVVEAGWENRSCGNYTGGGYSCA